MTYDIISYVLIGGFTIVVITPLIAWLRLTIREERELDEFLNRRKGGKDGSR